MTIPIQSGTDHKNIEVKITFKDNTIENITVPFIREYDKPVSGFDAIAEIRDRDFSVGVGSKKNNIKEIKSELLEKTWEVCSSREIGIDSIHKGIWGANQPPFTAYDLKEIGDLN
jgi:hypothetical protein